MAVLSKLGHAHLSVLWVINRMPFFPDRMTLDLTEKFDETSSLPSITCTRDDDDDDYGDDDNNNINNNNANNNNNNK